MKIGHVETRLYELPPHREIEDAVQRFVNMELVMVRIVTASGAEGCGFTYTIGQGGRAIKALLDSAVVPLLQGEDALAHERVWDKLWRALHWVGRSGLFSLAQSAVDIALWDLKARVQGLPLYRMLGGFREAVPAYTTDGGWLNHTKSALVAEAGELLAMGFTAMKVKVGKATLSEDLGRLTAVREAIGPDVGLMVDANMCFTVGEAVRRARALGALDLLWFEEPLEPDDVRGHQQVQAAVTTPVAVGESLYNRFAFAEYVRCNAARVLQPDVCRLGGVTEWMRVAALAAAHDLPVVPHFVPDLHIHLAAATPAARFVEYIPFLDRFLEEPLRVEGGRLSPPDRPGHGILFHEARMAPHRLA